MSGRNEGLRALVFVSLLTACPDGPPPPADSGPALQVDAGPRRDAGSDGRDAAGDPDAAASLIIPPDPRTIAPALPDDDVVPFFDRISFLLGPIQLDVAPGAIAPKRAAVIVGAVRERGGGPLAGVEITIPNAPELGRTHTRADGAFDLVVNGGGSVTLRYSLPGYLPVVRQVSADWTDYAKAKDVALTKLDAAMTRIDLANMRAAAIAPGSSNTDEAGTRRASVLFMPGTRATMHLPDGTVRPLTSLGVRATEYTVGPDGPQAMPGDLPFASGYTYAIELSVDEAIAAGATTVQFSKPVALYLDNYLGFATGEEIPLGYYQPNCNGGNACGAWIASANGRVVDFIRADGDRAVLDLDGDGVADSDDAHRALGINDDERRALARDRTAGAKLWRAPIPHFSAWDCNWSFGPPDNANYGRPQISAPNPYPATCGSILECPTRSVGQDIDVAGTPLTLSYRTRRNEGGRRPPIVFAATDSSTPITENMVAVHAALEIEGQTYETSFAPATNLSTAFEWDGKDRYGRPARGITRASISVGYEYRGDYRRAQSSITAFGLPGTGTRLVTGNDEARTITLWQTVEQLMPLEDTRAHGMGGFVPDHVERYNPEQGALVDADGFVERVISEPVTIAGTGSPERFEDTPESHASPSLSFVNAMAYAPDGSLVVGEVGGRGGAAIRGRIRKLSEQGQWTLVAESDGPAGSELDGPYYSMAHGPDGALYVGSDLGIYRIHPDGRKERIAGHDGPQEAAFPAERSRALDMAVYRVDQLAVGPDCTVYFASYGRSTAKIFAIGGDGLVYTIAGRGDRGDGSNLPREGMIATEADLGTRGLAVSDTGEVYFADAAGDAIWRIDQGGQLRHVLRSSLTAPDDPTRFSGKSALDVPRMVVTNLTFAPDASLLFSASNNGKWFLGQITPDGRFHYVMPEPPHLQYRAGQQYAVGPRGELAWVHNAGTNGDFIKRTRRDSAGADCAYAFPDKTSGKVRCFDVEGRLTSLRSELTGAVLEALSYDADHRLLEVRDAAGRATRIERDAGGLARAIVGPHGHRTELAYDGPWLSSITAPDGAIDRFEFDAAGLMRAHLDPNGGRATYEYERGLLTRATDATGATKTFAGAGTSSVTLTTAEGVTTVYGFRGASLRDSHSVTLHADGTRDEISIDAMGNSTRRHPDGTVTIREMTSDPALGTSAPRLARLERHTPGGVHSHTRATRSIGGDGLITEALVINNRTYETTWDPASRTLTTRTPMGRTSRVVLDEHERTVELAPAGLAPLRLDRDREGRVVTVRRGARSATFSYDSRSTIDRVVDSVGRESRFVRDPVGRVLSQTAGSSTVGYGYDPAGNMVSLAPPGRSAHRFDYDAEDRGVRHDLPDVGAGPAYVEKTLDGDGRVTSTRRPDGSVVEHAYDAGGRKARVSQGTTWRAYGYGVTGVLETVTAGNGMITAKASDGDLLTELSMSGPVSGRVTYGYDADGDVTVRTVGSQFTSFSYDADKLLTAAGPLSLTYASDAAILRRQTLGAVETSFDVNGYGEPFAATTSVAGSRLYRTELVFDAASRIIEERETAQGVTSVWRYARDDGGAIERIERDGVVEEELTHDARQNRVSRTRGGRVESSTYDAQDRLLTQGDWSFSWTANGDLATRTDRASGRVWMHRYDGLRALEAVELPDGREVSYVIDGLGRRVARAIDGVRTHGWLYGLGDEVIAEVDETGAVLTEYVYAGPAFAPTFMVRGAQTYRLVSDARGSIRLVVDTATGDVVQEIEYDRWGRVLADSNPGFQPFGFAAGLWDRDTGLVRFGLRDYDPEVGRWTQIEPLGFMSGDTSLFVYGRGDPVSNVDPGGDIVIPLAPFAVAAAAAGAYKLYEHFTEKTKPAIDNALTAKELFDRGQGNGDTRNLLLREAEALKELIDLYRESPIPSSMSNPFPYDDEMSRAADLLTKFCKENPTHSRCPRPCR